MRIAVAAHRLRWVSLSLTLAGCASAPAVPDTREAAGATQPAGGRVQSPGFVGGSELRGGPSTPALQALRGRMPLVDLARGPASPRRTIDETVDRPTDPAYELAVFDDGTLVYEGHRCVKVGGLVIARLGASELGHLRALLAERCLGFDRTTDNEVCMGGSSQLELTCSNGADVFSGSDRCLRGQDQGSRLAALAARVVDSTGVAPWLGAPTERQACTAGAGDLAPGELARTRAPAVAR